VQTPGKRCFPEEVGQCWRDTLDPVIGGNLNDIKAFIKAQPPSTVIGIGYTSNAGVNIVQNFTPDHDQAVKAARLPRGAFSSGCHLGERNQPEVQRHCSSEALGTFNEDSADFPKSPMKRVGNAIRWALLISSALIIKRPWNGFNGLLIILVWSKNSNNVKWRDLGFCTGSLFEWASPTQEQRLQSRFHELEMAGESKMLWARLLAYVTGTVNQELLLRNEYLVAENRILEGQIKGRLLLSEGERATLAEIAHRLGRTALEDVAATAKPNTILRWWTRGERGKSEIRHGAAIT
jgi:hypothetical protein